MSPLNSDWQPDITNRDLKPENLLYASSEPGAQLKLGDFGFAKQTVLANSLQAIGCYHNLTGGLSGPPVCKVHSLLCSPRGAWACRSEVQIPNVWFYSLELKHTRYGKACDVWSVGVICYVLLSGSPPFYTENPRLAISPGMKRRIHSAEYTFPPAQWSHISQVGSGLIALNFQHMALY